MGHSRGEADGFRRGRCPLNQAQALHFVCWSFNEVVQAADDSSQSIAVISAKSLHGLFGIQGQQLHFLCDHVAEPGMGRVGVGAGVPG